MSKTVYQTDQAGRYLGPIPADESPLEPGVWLMPAGCVEEPPPSAKKGQVAIWSEGRWALVPDEIAVVLPADTTPDRDIKSVWRETATASRAEFLKALVRLSILPGSDAVAAARGDWPKTFAAALEGLPVDPVEAQIDWASATHVARQAPLFLALLAYRAKVEGLDEAAAEALGDAVFGWSDQNDTNPKSEEP